MESSNFDDRGGRRPSRRGSVRAERWNLAGDDAVNKGARPQKRRGDKGASAVEFAIILPLLLMLIFGMIQYGFFFYSYQTGKSVADRYLRQLTVGNCQDADDLRSAVFNAMAGATTADTDISDGFNAVATYVDAAGKSADAPGQIGGSVTLTITYPTLNMNIPLVPFLKDATLTQSLTGRVEDTDSQGCS